jgi:hypothetical protein
MSRWLLLLLLLLLPKYEWMFMSIVRHFGACVCVHMQTNMSIHLDSEFNGCSELIHVYIYVHSIACGLVKSLAYPKR